MLKFANPFKKKGLFAESSAEAASAQKRIASDCAEFVDPEDGKRFYYEPREAAAKRLPAIDDFTQMSPSESAFLCGLLRSERPQKIVEVGVSAGGTTAVALVCCEMLGAPCRFYSVDISRQYYRDDALSTGYLAEDAIRNAKSAKHQFLTGHPLPEVIDAIGGDIDFAILDTVHRTPGEILDFICILPYLKNGAVVVLHDIAANHLWGGPETYATSLLFTAASGEKFYPFASKSENPANIAALRVNDATVANIFDCFFALSLPWHHSLSKKEAASYKKSVKKNYPRKLSEFFDYMLDKNAA